MSRKNVFVALAITAALVVAPSSAYGQAEVTDTLQNQTISIEKYVQGNSRLSIQSVTVTPTGKLTATAPGTIEITKLRLTTDHSIDRLLHGCVSSLDLVREFRYAKLNHEYSSVYTAEVNAEFPYKTVVGAYPVCAETLYHYQDSILSDVQMHYSNSRGQLQTRTDAFGLTATMTYNGMGLLSSTTDHLGNTTSYNYDRWGRRAKTTYPDHTADSTVYEWTLSDYSRSVFFVCKASTGQPTTVTTFDVLGNEVCRKKETYDGSWLTTDMVYDHRQRLAAVSYPYKSGSAASWINYSYDNYDRLLSKRYSDGTCEEYSYAELTKTVTKRGMTSVYSYNTLGDVVSVEDGGGTTTYVYNGEGNLLTITAPGGIVTSMTYDGLGRCIALTDPSTGTSSTEYDIAGNIVRTTDSRGKHINYIYDINDRLFGKQATGESAVTYGYDDYNRLVSQTAGNGTATFYTYDNYGRISSRRDNGLDGLWLKREYTYADGNLSSVRYSNQDGLITTENYIYQQGHLKKITAGNNRVVYNKTAESNYGQTTQFRCGSITHNLGFDVEGRIISQRATSFGNTFLNFSYSYDTQTGNLSSRTDENRHLTEIFQYDMLDRLTHSAGQRMVYDEKGNITSNSLVGEYVYDVEQPYAVSGIYYGLSQMPEERQDLTFNGFGLVETLSQTGRSATFQYDSHGHRTKMTYNDGQTVGRQYTRYYIDDKYEVQTTDTTAREILYLGGDAYDAPAAYVRINGSIWTIHYICRDYQGSVMAVVSEAGAVLQELSYDAWGNLRHPDGHNLYTITDSPELFLGRGYTGHEHLTEFGLINMNARLYDPLLGRFISPDPYVQSVFSSQSFNRYSYCLNNPISRIDRDGKIAPLVAIGVAAGIGALVNVGFQAIAGNINGWGDFFKAAGIGAAAGGVGTAAVMVCGVSAAGFIGGAVSGLIAGGAGSLAAEAYGAAFYGDTFSWSNVLIGTISGGVVGGVVGGVTSVLKGGNFWTGEVKAGTPMPQTSNTTETAAQSSQTNEIFGPDKNSVSETAAKSLDIADETMISPTTCQICESEGSYSVYSGFDTENNVRYIGITGREPKLRFADHLRSETPRAKLRYEVLPDMTGLSKINARIIEQTYINIYGLGKNGGQLYNIINSISPRYWDEYGINIKFIINF